MSKSALNISTVPSPFDQQELIESIRECDLHELTAAYALPVDEIIDWSVRLSRHYASVRMDGQLACVAGVTNTSILTGLGTPWFIGTRALDESPRAILINIAPDVLAIWKGSFSMLRNWVDDRNRLSIRWLRWMGFKVHDPEPYGPYGMPFRMFEMEVN